MRKNKIFKSWLGGFCVMMIFLIVLSSLSVEGWGQTRVDAEKIAKKVQKIPRPKGFLNLEFEKYFPDEAMAEKDVYLKGAYSITGDGRMNIYCTDQKQGRILVFDRNGAFVKSIGRPGQGPGEFNDPKRVVITDQGKIIVLDAGNRRVQILNQNGEYLKSFKIFNSYASILWVKERIVLTRALIRKENEKVLDVFDMEGSLLTSFGEIDEMKMGLREKNRDVGPFEVVIAKSDNDEIYVGWQRFAEVHKYSFSGVLLKKIRINYQKLIEYDEYNKKVFASETGEHVYLNTIWDIWCGGKSSLVLFTRLDSPSYEFLECDEDGHVLQVYWAKGEDQTIDRGFTMIRSADRDEFFILRFFPDSEIRKFIYKKSPS